ncbi:MAG TPA: hypothetical protein VEW08_00755 [Steroidobacteraceae bacterium]|nr:hypothetical protein [Steroidobacteraceae bacterium]
MPHRASAAALIAALGAAFAHTACAAPPASPVTDPAEKTGCFAAGNGYLRARIRGAVDLDLDWKDAQMQCEGGPRPPGKDNQSNGIRVSIAGPLRGDGRRIRLVFGIGGVVEGRGGETLRTNVTILFEGEHRIFATLGDDKCTVDSLTQQRVESLGADRAIYRVEARGFCLGAATSLSKGERVLLTSFDFAGRVEFEDDARHAPDPQSP